MADSKSILIVRPASLDDATRAAFAEAGVLIVEAVNPDDVRLLTAEPMPLSGSDMLCAAIGAIASSMDSVSARFVRNLHATMQQASLPRPATPPVRDKRGRFVKSGAKHG